MVVVVVVVQWYTVYADRRRRSKEGLEEQRDGADFRKQAYSIAEKKKRHEEAGARR